MRFRIAAVASIVVVAASGGAFAWTSAAPAPAGARIVVRFAAGASRQTQDALLARAGVRPLAAVPALRAVVARVPAGRRSRALALLRRDRSVSSAEPDGLARLLDAAPPALAASVSSSSSWQATHVQLPLAWQVTTGPNVVVAVVDTGVQADHPALQGRVLPGHNFVANSDDASDDEGHGTAVAGVIAADGGGVTGACTGCEILPVKVLDASGTGDWGTIAAGIVWAADHGAQVINLSLGSPHVLDVVGAAVAYAESKGAIVVAAAGNAGVATPFYPAAYPGVISVAGVDENNARYSWSNYGGWVTVAAPGCVTTTWSGGGYDADFCGTSTAAPFVAGLAGLARSFKPSVSASAFASALAQTAAPVADSATAGAGLVDANGMLVALGAPTAPPVPVEPPALPAPVVGKALRATPGSWRDGVTYTYGWQRSHDGSVWRELTTAPRYTPTAADAGYRLRLVVTAANARGTTTAVSPASAPVAALQKRHAHS